MTINFLLFYLRCVVTNEVARGAGLIPPCPCFIGRKRKCSFFERITTLLHPITYRHITGDGVNEIIVRRWEDKEDGFNNN